jgi:hypothetical protein
LSKLYPTEFSNKWNYVSIEAKNVGFFSYSRAIYNFSGKAYQGVVRTTHNVSNSQTLISWDLVNHIENATEVLNIKIGVNYDWTFGLNPNYFFNFTGQVQSTSAAPSVADLLCSYSANGKFLACYGDYYADDNGVCVKVTDEC